MFIVTDQDGNVTKYRSLRDKRLVRVSISCTKDSYVEDALLDECVIQGEFSMTFKQCHISKCKIYDITISMIDSVSFFTHYYNTTFHHVHHSSITSGSINSSVLKEVRGHFLKVDFNKITLQGVTHEIALSNCRGMVSASGLGRSDRTAYCYNSPDGPTVALGCFRGTRKQAAYIIATKYGDSPRGKLYVSAVEMLFDLLEDQ